MESRPILRPNNHIIWIRPDGTVHRMDGPAVIWPDGYSYWVINGWYVNFEIHKWAVELGIDLNTLTEYDKNLIAMKWSAPDPASYAKIQKY